ncbi:hypothetical protein FQZ97_864520 [compost metagenome]
MVRGDQGQREQQGREELAGHVAAHADRLVERQRLRGSVAQPKRWVALLAQAVHRAAELAQRIHEVANGALVHAGDAAEFKRTAVHAGQQRQRGGQGAHGCAGVAQKKLLLLHGQGTTEPMHPQRAVVLGFDAAAELGQCGQHHPGVVRIQQIGDVGVPDTQGREQQHAVGDALGAGQAHGPACAAQGGDVKVVDGVHDRSGRTAGTADRDRRNALSFAV